MADQPLIVKTGLDEDLVPAFNAGATTVTLFTQIIRELQKLNATLAKAFPAAATAPSPAPQPAGAPVVQAA